MQKLIYFYSSRPVADNKSLNKLKFFFFFTNKSKRIISLINFKLKPNILLFQKIVNKKSITIYKKKKLKKKLIFLIFKKRVSN